MRQGNKAICIQYISIVYKFDQILTEQYALNPLPHGSGYSTLPSRTYTNG